MKLPYSSPIPSGSKRATHARQLASQAGEVARLRPQPTTRSNREECDHGPEYPANFTKGLLHNSFGIVTYGEDYARFVEAINSEQTTLFETSVQTAATRAFPFACTSKTTCDGSKPVTWRGWESPRAGHAYDTEGADAGACAMAPAPRVGSSELAAEMAEVYALALLRDVPFTSICRGEGKRLCASSEGPSDAKLSADQVVALLNAMPFYAGNGRVSSTPSNAENGLNHFERARRFARTQGVTRLLTPETVFRGSTAGALKGPYLSQFLLIGARSLACAGGTASASTRGAQFNLEDGFIPFGAQVLDQRTLGHKGCLDYMTDWGSWLDVQNGANLKGADRFEDKRRFITTPRDLATYVHYDALYQAYLNACLLLLALGVPFSKGFPEPSPSGRRDPFATFGGPHILSWVTEVATRCLKAVRRQKFCYHRRARPEALGGRLTLIGLNKGAELGKAAAAFEATYNELPPALRDAVIAHNAEQKTMASMRGLACKKNVTPNGVNNAAFEACNLLLPMAFPEGSPMHPSYGAGHATVAGGCVTMLKAFFEMFETANSFVERPLTDQAGAPIAFVPNASGSKLVQNGKTCEHLTIQGELDKLAANIAIGRDMAGVHYYSDYYDSLRMGERIAVGILLEHAPSYGETVEMTFTSFDGDHLTLSADGGNYPALSVLDRSGNVVAPDAWWLRHTSGQEITEDW